MDSNNSLTLGNKDKIVMGREYIEDLFEDNRPTECIMQRPIWDRKYKNLKGTMANKNPAQLMDSVMLL